MHISETQANSPTKVSHAMRFGSLPRPLTMQEMDLALEQANTPTSASNVSFSSLACSAILGAPGATRINRAPPLRPQQIPMLARHSNDLEYAGRLSACAVLLHQQQHLPASTTAPAKDLVHSAHQPTPIPKARNAHRRLQKCQSGSHAPVTRDGNWSSCSSFNGVLAQAKTVILQHAQA